MTDGAGNCATARASLSLEDLENEMRRAIPRPVHHNEFFSQRWAIFAPPPVFCPTPGALIGTKTGPDSKSKGTTGKSAERRPTPPPSAAALDLTEAGCGPRCAEENSKKFGLFWVRFGREIFPASDFRRPNGYRSSPPYPQRNLVIFQT